MGTGPNFSRAWIRGVLIASGVLLVLAAGAELAAEETASRGAHCFALPHTADSFDAHDAGHRLRQRDFDVYETSAIELDVRCIGEAPGTLRVQVHLPNGDLYETIEAASDRSGAVGRRPRLAPDAKAQLPVAGTFITQYGLLGTWSARVCWDEASRPTCGRAVRFTLER